MKHTSHARSAFSLVELSVVLLVIGLLVGGILGAKTLTRAGELRSITVDRERYIGAIRAFKDKYNGLPGDLINATSIWGAAHATPATCKTTQGTGTQTCDGDGDGKIGVNGNAVTYYEKYRAWQHLANAGLIEGNYSGLVMGTGTPGVNLPASKVSGSGFSFLWIPPVNGASGSYFDGSWGQIMFFGAQYTGNLPVGPAITADEAWSIDTKVDDGRPAYGKVLAFKNGSGWTPNCTTTSASATSLYNLANTSNTCGLQFLVF